MPKPFNSVAAVRAAPPTGRVTLGALSPRKRAFVVAYLENVEAGNIGLGSAPDAVQAAGISPDNRNSARVRAAEFMRDPDVLAVLRDELTKKLSAGAAIGVAVLIDLARHAKSETVKFQAAAQLIDRSPIGPVVSRSAALNANVSIEELLAKLDTGAQPAKVVDDEAEVIEGQAVELTPEDEADAEFRQIDPIRQRWAAQAQQAQEEEAPEDVTPGG